MIYEMIYSFIIDTEEYSDADTEEEEPSEVLASQAE